MAKILIKSMSNRDNYNEIEIEKSSLFLDNLQRFVVDIGLVNIKKGHYTFENKSYDLLTYYTLFYEDPKKDFELIKLKIRDFNDGTIVRYFNKSIELLIIFLTNRIKLVFYCNQKNRKKVINALLKFCNFSEK